MVKLADGYYINIHTQYISCGVGDKYNEEKVNLSMKANFTNEQWKALQKINLSNGNIVVFDDANDKIVIDGYRNESENMELKNIVFMKVADSYEDSIEKITFMDIINFFDNYKWIIGGMSFVALVVAYVKLKIV